METMNGMKLDQSKDAIETMQCVHSTAAGISYPHWDQHWTLDADVEDTDESLKVFCNQDLSNQTFLTETRFLAAVQSHGLITLLFTVGRKQKYPLCSRVNCSNKVKCICFKKYQKLINEAENDENITYYWDQKSSKRPGLVNHFLEDLPHEDHHRRHGYNVTKIEYPIKRSEELQQKFMRRLEGCYDLPDRIVPKFDNQVCQHNHLFSQNDDQLLRISSHLTVYTELSDKTFPIPTFGRPTEGGCKCILQADTHDLLLWNMGGGNLIDYVFIHCHLHKMVSSGIAMNASFTARQTSLSDIGLQSSLTYPLFLRACTGYAHMIQFRREDFLCTNCGESPSYIVCDGKTDGPAKRKVEHLKELDKPEEDDSVLSQGSLFHDRIFLSENRERKLACSLLTDTISLDEFLESDDISTVNGLMVKRLVDRISVSWPEEIPVPYKRFLGNICKASSVAGFLQVLSVDALDFLAEFCHERLDIRSAENNLQLKQVAEEMPALWPNLIDILNLEKFNFLPEDVSVIILKLIEIRKKTFSTAAVRSPDDYILWEDPDIEHSTQYYPIWPIWRYPKKYTVRNVVDCDFCDKNFNQHRDFSFGVFSAGCACPLNITYGYELMLCRESAHNIFRLLMCRDVDLLSLKGIIFDHACGLGKENFL